MPNEDQCAAGIARAAIEANPLGRSRVCETAYAPSPHDTRALPVFEGSPALLVDLLLAALLKPGGGLVTLDLDGTSAVVARRRGNATIAQLATSGDVGAAAIGRLARMAGLDPLAERGSLTGPRAARIVVRAERVAEVLLTLGATAVGLSAELRLLVLEGRPVEQRRVAQLKRCVACGAYQSTHRQRCEVDGGALREQWDDPTPGGTIGPYLLRSRLGKGAMGEVFAAEHAFIERRAAIKVLRAPTATDPGLEARFLLEARATSRLRHPSIVVVTDYGVLASGAPYIVMERLEGEALEQRLAHHRALAPDLALRIARATALGLSAAHDGGVIHNDLKPSNVILLSGAPDDAPELKIIDFGAASIVGAPDDDDMVVGTAAFMAPERICGDPSDPRSDIYSLGVMLYRMVTGTLPFDAAEARDMFTAQVHDTPKPLESPLGVLPSRVVRTVTRALQKKPDERYQTMKQMVADIDEALASLTAPSWRRWLP